MHIYLHRTVFFCCFVLFCFWFFGFFFFFFFFFFFLLLLLFYFIYLFFTKIECIELNLLFTYLKFGVFFGICKTSILG